MRKHAGTQKPLAHALESRLLLSGSPLANVDIVGFQRTVSIGAYTYFEGQSSVDNSRALWRTDGTAANTSIVMRSVVGVAQFTRPLAAVGNTLFFYVQNGTERGLWKSAGTPATTSFVTAISEPNALAVFNSKLYYNQNGGLWRTDGTAAGTVQVANTQGIFQDLEILGNELYGSTYGGYLYRIKLTSPDAAEMIYQATDLKELAACGGNLWFVATNATIGTELFRFSPATSQVMPVDIYLGGNSSYARELTVAGNWIYYEASSASSSNSLWRTEGTTGASYRVYSTNYAYGTVHNITAMSDGTVYFSAFKDSDYGLYKTGGPQGYTTQITFGTTNGADGVDYLTTIGNTLYFNAYDNATIGGEWYRTNSSSSTAGILGNLSGNNSRLVANGKFVFSGRLVAATTTGRSLFIDRLDRSIIDGIVWQDRNADGALGTYDQVLAGRTVWIDTDNDAALDPGEPSTLTNAAGEYQFYDLLPGTIRVRQLLPDATWTAVAPSTALHSINATAGSAASLRDFSSRIRNTGVIAGSAFEDYNHNGVQDGIDRAVPTTTPRTIYLDANNNGVLDAGERSTTTTASGAFVFYDLPMGAQRLRQVLPGGYVQTFPATPHDFTLTDLQEATGKVFAGDPPPASLTLTGRFGTLAYSGIPSAIVGAAVYLDLDGDTQPDVGEPTSVTDANGLFAFPTLDYGRYTVRPLDTSNYYGTVALVVTLYTSTPITTPMAFTVREYLRVVATRFDVDLRQVLVTYDRSPGPVPASVFTLHNLDTGATIASTNFTVSTNTGIPNTIAIRLSAAFAWQDARYRFSAPATSIRSATNDPLNANFSFEFRMLAGDATQDQAVNFDDLLILAQNYGQTGRTFSQGDFNYDGRVNFDDLLVLAQTYGQSLPGLRVASTMPTAATKKRSQVVDAVQF